MSYLRVFSRRIKSPGLASARAALTSGRIVSVWGSNQSEMNRTGQPMISLMRFPTFSRLSCGSRPMWPKRTWIQPRSRPICRVSFMDRSRMSPSPTWPRLGVQVAADQYDRPARHIRQVLDPGNPLQVRLQPEVLLSGPIKRFNQACIFWAVTSIAISPMLNSSGNVAAVIRPRTPPNAELHRTPEGGPAAWPSEASTCLAKHPSAYPSHLQCTHLPV